jgi:plastocyanin
MTGDDTDDRRPGLARRAVLRAVGASAALSAATTTAAADGDGDRDRSPTDDGTPAGDRPAPPTIDPVFGAPAAGENPCAPDADESCFDAFPSAVRPSAQVEMEIGIPEPLLAFGQFGAEESVDVAAINAAVADEPLSGSVAPGDLAAPDDPVTIPVPDGAIELTVLDLANLLVGTSGFHYHPAGLRVAPGDVVLYSARTPDHAVAAYHEGHGRQNRVPDGVPPLSSPLVPVGGYWLYRFETPGVYDLYCPPHQTFGMVERVVVTADGSVPDLDVEETGRPPQGENAVPSILGGLDPDLPPSAAVLDSAALAPAKIVEDGSVPWSAVVDEYRTA